MQNATTKDDLGFKNKMESCEFPPFNFKHRAHLRLACIYLIENGTDKSSELMRDTMHRFLLHNGVDPSIYHATITKTWILAVQHFMHKSQDSGSADELIERNPELLDKNIMMTRYSAGLLFSGGARAAFVQPDLAPIPRYGA